MARVSNDQVREYRKFSETLSAAAGDAIRETLSGLDLRNDNVRKLIVNSVLDGFNHFGNASASLGRVWYQQCRDTQSDGTAYYVADEYFDDSLYGKLTRSVNDAVDKAEAARSGDDNLYDEWLRDFLASSDDEPSSDAVPDRDAVIDDALIDDIADTLSNYVYKVNRDTVIANIDNENAGVMAGPATPTRVEQRRALRSSPRGRVAYMRVPADNCACSFCMIMASRGPVYKTKESAGGGDLSNKYHLHCRCAVVPVSVNDPFIDGYSYDGYQDMYYEAREAWSTNSYSDDVAKRIERGKANAVKNDRDWRDINEIEIVMRDMYELH
jgi:hypothetical protein